MTVWVLNHPPLAGVDPRKASAVLSVIESRKARLDYSSDAMSVNIVG